MLVDAISEVCFVRHACMVAGHCVGDLEGSERRLRGESGSVYRCKLHVEDEGARLVVRGYLGFSLLGRSQTWRREH